MGDLPFNRRATGIGPKSGSVITHHGFTLFIRQGHPKVLKARKWVEQTNAATLFMVALFPFTPSAFVNFAFGVSEFSRKKYLITLYGAKLIMISLLAIVGQSAVSAIQNPWFILISIGILVVTYILSKKITKMKIDHVNNKEAEKTDFLMAIYTIMYNFTLIFWTSIFSYI